MAKIEEYKRVNHNGLLHYGKHLLLNSSGCNHSILNRDIVKSYVIKLCDDIDMQRYGDCHIHRFGHGIEIGFSVFQLIFTSNISMHTNDAQRDCYFDVFSCKDYDIEKVLKSFINQFNPRELSHEVIYRQ